MKTIKTLFKGILLYSTILITISYICALDSLMGHPKYMLYGGYVILGLLTLCYAFLSQDDLLVLTFNKKK
jgi:hypothetical protein